MGNAQFNSTFTAKNYSNITNSTGGIIATTLPPFRPPQSREDIDKQLEAIACVGTLTFAINLTMVIFTSIRLKEVPYMCIQNFMVIDIINAAVTSGPWAVGVLFDFTGLGALPFLCRIQGFFHATLATVFLGTVTAIAVSQFLYIVSPSAYSMFFVHKPVVRLLLFSIWFGAGFLSSPPLNPGVWGTYATFEGTCWLSWNEGNDAAITYSAFHTFITLGPAVTFTVLAIVFVVRKRKNIIHPSPAAPPAQLSNQPGLPPPTSAMMGSPENGTHFLNREVLYISCALFLLYLILWTAITVVEAMFIVHWSKVDYRAVIVFTFMYQSRGILHPFIYLLLSPKMRRAFVRCTGKETSVADVQTPGQ